MSEVEEAESIYQPLDEAKRQIRLVRITGQHEGVLHLDLAVCALDDEPDFVALSYCWMTNSATHQVMVNGQDFLVRPNLYDYLLRVNKDSDRGWRFIDAICINQDCIPERNQQVRLMGAIYRSAQHVEAWLGTGAGSFPNKADLSGLAVSSHTHDVAVYALRSEYWSRLWIVQELLLARTWRIRVADWEIRGDELARGSKESRDVWSVAYLLRRLESPNAEQRYLTLTSIAHLRNTSRLLDGQALPLARVLAIFPYQSCSDIRDKVFGMLGLTITCIEADYTMPLSEIFIRVMLECNLQARIILLQLAMSRADDDDDNYQSTSDLVGATEALITGFGWRADHPTVAHLLRETLSPSDYEFHLSTIQRLAQSGRRSMENSADHNRVMACSEKYLTNSLYEATGRLTNILRRCGIMSRLTLAQTFNRPMILPANCDAEPPHTYHEWVAVVKSIKAEIYGRLVSVEYIERVLASTGKHHVKIDGQGDPRAALVESFLRELRKQVL